MGGDGRAGINAAISGSQAVISPSGHRHRPVLVTPVLPPKPTIKPVIDKLLLKAVMKGKPKESKMFTLRNLDPNRIVSCKDLMREIQDNNKLLTLFLIQLSSVFQSNDSLPTSQTCFFQLRLPNYVSQEVLSERLRYAIRNCRSIDMDNYMLRRGGDEYDSDVDDYDDDDDDL